MHQPAPRKTVLQTILDWSQIRPAWQRDALRRIVTSGTLDPAGVSEILDLCKKEHGAPDIELEAMPLELAHLPANPGNGSAITLASLSDVVGVNQLAPKQTLPFEQQGLTIIYGPNGAGKSGYGRVLKRACRARKAGKIMPDAFSLSFGGKATASFTIARDGVLQPVLPWEDNATPDPVLSSVSVFDRECGAVHIQDKNEVAFRPFGLDIPDDLAAVCTQLKTLLQGEEGQLKALRDPVFDAPTWQAATAVGGIMSQLKHDSNLDRLNDGAYRQGVPTKMSNLSRGPDGTGIVGDGLPWDHAGVKARVDRLEKDQRAAKLFYDANDEDGYRRAAVKLYGHLRATWERALEEIVFAGVLLRHRDYIDTKNLKKVSVLVEADAEAFRAAFKKCSDIIDAHDPSRVRNEEPPPPTEIADDIKILADWAESLRARQRAIP